METAESLINDSLQELIVQASEQPIQPVDFQTAKRYLNRMMAALDSIGIALGYTVVVEPEDPITVPAGAIEGMIKNLAVKLSTQYSVPVGPLLFQEAKDGITTMRKIARVPRRTELPCTLPVGQANEHFDSDWHFFPCPESELLTEQGGSILLEDETANE
jgi:hypothetical protein